MIERQMTIRSLTMKRKVLPLLPPAPEAMSELGIQSQWFV